MPRLDGFHRPAALLQGFILLAVGVVIILLQPEVPDSWPLFLLGPSILAVNASLRVRSWGGQVLTLASCAVLTAAAVLFQQAIIDYYRSWAYAWALVVPGAVGGGLLLRRAVWGLPPMGFGLWFLVLGIGIFLVGWVVFEGVIGIGGLKHPEMVRAGLPALFVFLGLLFLAEGWLSES